MSTHLEPRVRHHQRKSSSSGFAESFDVARSRLNELDMENVDMDPNPVAPPAEPHHDDVDDDDDDHIIESSPPSPASMVSDHSVASPASSVGTPDIYPDVADNFAFAFDIDGVLVRGGQVIPEAVEAMKVLNGENEYGIRVPYIFLTNGGGKFETERCQDLSRQLQIDVSPGQFICGHTPMRELADRYHGTVLVVGGEGEKCRDVAASYGFRDVITPGDILKANAATAPFRKLTEREYADSRDLLGEAGGRASLSDIVVEAVFVFADSRDWAGDLQIILDIAMSKGGRLETRSETFDEGPPIYFSHNDVVWSAAHEHVRLGMGALRRIVEVVFAEVTGGKKLETHAFGKPQIGTFEFATRLLQHWRAAQHGLAESAPPDTVYFVGDTPESDVRGTNAMDAKSANDWHSILVKTGVYQDGTVPAYQPRKTVPTVLEAVRYGIDREMARRSAAVDPLAAKSVGLTGRQVPTVQVHAE